MTQIQVGSAIASPGEISFGNIFIGEHSDSTVIDVPTIVMNGISEGPTLLLSAAVHGPEITGSEVIRRICREIVDPKKLTGAIIALPIANPFAFRTTTWINLEDGFNLNRSFPGTSDGWLTSRLAYALMETAVKQADAILDIHCMCDPSLLFTTVKHDEGNDDLYNRCMEMAKAFGLGVIEHEGKKMAHRLGGMLEAAAEFDIPAITPELQYWRRIDPISVEVGVRGSLNIMRHLGMIDGAVEPQDEKVKALVGISRWTEIFSNKGGLVNFIAQPGDALEEGGTIALVRNPYGDLVEDIKSPIRGTLIGYPIFNNQAVRTGEMLAFIASQMEESRG